MNEKKGYSKLVIDAANDYIGYPPELGEGLEVYMRREAFKEGACWMERKILNLGHPKLPKEIMEKEIEFVDKCLGEGVIPTFAGAIQYTLKELVTKS